MVRVVVFDFDMSMSCHSHYCFAYDTIVIVVATSMPAIVVDVVVLGLLCCNLVRDDSCDFVVVVVGTYFCYSSRRHILRHSLENDCHVLHVRIDCIVLVVVGNFHCN